MTRFSWESPAGGSLILKVASGPRETTWRIRKNMSTKDVAEALDQAVNALLGGEPARTWPADYNPMPMKETVRTVEGPITEKQSMADLAAKAAAVRVQGSMWDRPDLELYGDDDDEAPDE